MKTTAIVVLVVSLAGCITDLRSRRIPNVLTFGSALAALLFHTMTGGLTGAGTAAAGWLLGGAVFFLPFYLGGMGAGDVKLMAALGAWLGPSLTIWLAIYTGIAGAVLAVIVALSAGYLRQALSNIWLLLTHWRASGIRPLDELTLAHSTAPRLAYAVPICAGTVLTLWLR